VRGLIQFAIFIAAIFFIVGNFFGGWYLGILPQTQAFLYKKTYTATVTRRAISRSDLPFTIKGKLSDGSVTLQAIYEKPTSFQNPNRKAIAPKVYFEETFEANQPILISEELELGQGVYRIRLQFTDATGRIEVEVPPRNGM